MLRRPDGSHRLRPEHAFQDPSAVRQTCSWKQVCAGHAGSRKSRKEIRSVDLFSTDLAGGQERLSDLRYVQWQHDLRLLELRREKLLRREGDFGTEQVLVDSQNDESKSSPRHTRRPRKSCSFSACRKSRDRSRSLKNLGGDAATGGTRTQSATRRRTTRLSPGEGIVIQRDAVAWQSLRQRRPCSWSIAPFDHLFFVWVNVYEADQARVALNQEMEIRFPYLDRDA